MYDDGLANLWQCPGAFVRDEIRQAGRCFDRTRRGGCRFSDGGPFMNDAPRLGTDGHEKYDDREHCG